MSIVYVNHDYPREAALKTVDAANQPIEGVEIRIFPFVTYLAEDLSTPYFMTQTDAEGAWEDTAELPAAHTWVVHFQKPDEASPSSVEITT